MNDEDLTTFLAQLHEEVRDRAVETGSNGEDARVEAYARILAEELAELGDVPDLEICLLDDRTTKGNVRSHGYAFDEETGRLDLLVAVYRPDPEPTNLTQTEIRQAFERAVRIQQLVQQGRGFGDPNKSDQAAMLGSLRDYSSDLREIRVLVVSNGRARDTSDIHEEIGGIPCRCLVWDLVRHHRVRSSGKEYEAIEIDLREFAPEGIPCLPMPDAVSGYRTYLALLPGDLLFSLYDRYGSRLLQLNVRSFLQARGKVNKGIRNTIINEPKLFLAYNNGLTATVEHLDCETSASGQPVITRLRGFQVVNGGQTVASIHLAHKKDRVPLDDVLVQAKISKVDETLLGELVPQISRFANTQNRVSEADFSSNDPFHVKLEELAERTWAPGEQTRWFYERARGQYQVAKARSSVTPAQRRQFEQATPTANRFAKTDLAKYVHSWEQLPHLVSRGAQKNFTVFMERLAATGRSFEPDERWYRGLIAQAILFRAAEKVARKLNITPYRANVITFTVALLSYRTQQRVDLARIWEVQNVSDSLLRTYEAWMPEVHRAIVGTAGGRNVTEWCKKEDCWRQLQTLELELPSGLERELAEGQPLPNVGEAARHGKVELTGEDRANIAKTMLVPADGWLAIHQWGTTTGELAEYMCGIAHTLIAYAAGGWAKVPSAKQARQAVKMIDAAKGNVPALDGITGL